MSDLLISKGELKPSSKNLSADLLAGLTFAVANIPTAMAHALMATVNPVVGIYTLMVAMPAAALFTSSVFMNVSTTSALSVAVASSLIPYSGERKLQALATLVLMIGIIELVLGLLKMGTLLRFVPNSVMVGFVNGVAVLIILGQLSDLTGYDSAYANKVAKTLDTLLHLDQIHWPSLLVGLLTIAIILGLSRTRLYKLGAILGLVTATAIVAVFNSAGIEQIQDIADIPASLPKLALPDPRLIFAMLLPAVSVSIVGLVQGAAVSQKIPNPDGKFPDSSRDFFGQGIANIATSFVQGIPAGGSMSGTSVNISSGAKSRWTNIFAGIFVVLIVLVFSPLVDQIPMPALAGLVILAGFQSLQIPAAITVWQTGRVPGMMMLLTFSLTLVIPLQYAVLVGVAFSIMLFIISASNQVKVVQVIPVEDGWPIEAKPPAELGKRQITSLMIYGSVFFASSQLIESALPKLDNADRSVILLAMRGHTEIGSTFINVLWRYVDALHQKNSQLMLVGIDAEVRDRLIRTGFLQVVGEENVFMATPQFGEAYNQALAVARAWIKAAD